MTKFFFPKSLINQGFYNPDEKTCDQILAEVAEKNHCYLTQPYTGWDWVKGEIKKFVKVALTKRCPAENNRFKAAYIEGSGHDVYEAKLDLIITLQVMYAQQFVPTKYVRVGRDGKLIILQ